MVIWGLFCGDCSQKGRHSQRRTVKCCKCRESVDVILDLDDWYQVVKGVLSKHELVEAFCLGNVTY